jgi:2-polyprenyl-3-methyl-5-hydroxy-6-metoxy-1,4-benzoquinol methylase
MSKEAGDIIKLYERQAAGWDADRAYRRPEGEAGWIRRFSAEAVSGARILDLGCGSGEPIVPDLLALGHTVTGVDGSASLIALCRERFPAQSWITADMRQLDLGRRFGGILLWHSLFHLVPEDQENMFPLLAEHLKPGAPLMFTSGTERGESLGSWRGEALYHASLDIADYERLLVENGFELIDRVEGDASCGGATIWIARLSRDPACP